jgi:hypothetical protein
MRSNISACRAAIASRSLSAFWRARLSLRACISSSTWAGGISGTGGGGREGPSGGLLPMLGFSASEGLGAPRAERDRHTQEERITVTTNQNEWWSTSGGPDPIHNHTRPASVARSQNATLTISHARYCARTPISRHNRRTATWKGHNLGTVGVRRVPKSLRLKRGLAPQVGFEPTTLRLTAGCSTLELLRTRAGGTKGNLSCGPVGCQTPLQLAFVSSDKTSFATLFRVSKTPTPLGATASITGSSFFIRRCRISWTGATFGRSLLLSCST